MIVQHGLTTCPSGLHHLPWLLLHFLSPLPAGSSRIQQGLLFDLSVSDCQIMRREYIDVPQQTLAGAGFHEFTGVFISAKTLVHVAFVALNVPCIDPMR